jgi:hypothetical protein
MKLNSFLDSIPISHPSIPLSHKGNAGLYWAILGNKGGAGCPSVFMRGSTMLTTLPTASLFCAADPWV